MTKTLVIELPDELQQQLWERANNQNVSLESLVSKWVGVGVGDRPHHIAEYELPYGSSCFLFNSC